MSYLIYNGKRVISGGKFAILAESAPPPPPTDEMLLTTNLVTPSFYIDGPGSVGVDWSDGSTGTYALNGTYPAISHTYAGPGEETITISNASILTYLYIDDLGLTSLIIPSVCTNIIELSINRNELTTLELPASLPALTKIYSDHNFFTTFSLSNSPLFTQLWLHQNLLTSVSLTNLSSLGYVMLDNNQLTSFTVDTAWPLKQLNLRNNLISSDTIIDQILVDCVATSIGAGDWVYVDGAGMAFPTATGLAAIATLEGRGVTVIYNT